MYVKTTELLYKPQIACGLVRRAGEAQQLVMCMARLQAVGQAKLGQSHGLTTALARLEILESQSRRLRPWLLNEFFGP